MSTIQVKWKDREVLAAIRLMKAHRGSWSPVFKELKKPWREDLKAHAAREEGPDARWAKRAVRTHLRGRRKKGQALKGGGKRMVRRGSRRLLGKLPSAVTFRVSRGSILGVSKVPWSEVHNTGGKVGRGSMLPKREFLYVSPAIQQLAADRMAAYAVKEFGR